MASRPLSVVRRVRGREIDAPLAAFAGLSAAFAAFAMPADLLASIAGQGGLSFLAGLESPPGVGARLAIGGAAATIVFAAVFALLRGIERAEAFARRAPSRADEEDSDPEPPRLRRRDFHPDAPAPRPIYAARDLGDPGGVGEETQPLPIWLADAQGAGASMEPFDFSREDPVDLEAPEELVLATPLPDPEPAVTAPPVAERIGAPAGESIEEMVARLERGIVSRRTAAAAAPALPAGDGPRPALADPADDRLRNAIESLQRLAARQH